MNNTRLKPHLIPFNLVPWHWGLKGKAREEAEIYWEHEPNSVYLKFALNDLENDAESKEWLINDLDIQLNADMITDEDYSYRMLPFSENKEQDELDLDLKYGKIADKAYAKATATLRGEGWVDVESLIINKENPSEGDFTMDWNDEFIAELEAAGYEGDEPQHVVDVWFTELCKHVALQEFDGVGTFNEDLDMLDEVKEIRTEKPKDGRTEYK